MMRGLRSVCCGLLSLAACRCETPTAPARTELVSLVDGSVVLARGARLVNVRRDGTIAWDVNLPRGDRIAAPLSDTREGTVFVRGATSLYALKAGTILWRQLVPALPPGADARLYAPLPGAGNAALMMTEPGRFAVFGHDRGEIVWEVRVPGKARVVAPARSTADGSLVIPTTAGLYAVASDGKLDWHQAP